MKINLFDHLKNVDGRNRTNYNWLQAKSRLLVSSIESNMGPDNINYHLSELKKELEKSWEHPEIDLTFTKQ
jgi:hypothetical protein